MCSSGQVKEEDTVTVGQVIAKIAAGEMPANAQEDSRDEPATGPSDDQTHKVNRDTPTSAGAQYPQSPHENVAQEHSNACIDLLSAFQALYAIVLSFPAIA